MQSLRLPLVLIVILAVIAAAIFGVITLVQNSQAGNQAVDNQTADTPVPDGPVTITLAVSSFTTSVFDDKLISAFEASHPGIKVSIARVDASIPPAALGLDQHFSAVQQYASAADVLYVTNSSLLGTDTATLSVEATRAGYFLDLKPFVDEDKQLNPDDFFPPIWQSYQWDGGVWALPFAADPYVLNYSISAFDKAGLAYPNDKWTVDDLTNAVQKLSLKDAKGKVTDPGLDIYGAQNAFVFRGLLNNSVLDTNAIPNTPKFDTPEVAALFDDWLKLDQDGMIGAEYNKAPLSVAPAITLIARPSADDKRAATLLPGGRATLNVQAFAVSGGTQYPKEAYTLAAWLTTRGDVANNSLASSPARKSLLGAQGTDVVPFTLNVSPDMQALVSKAIANAIPGSEMRYIDYLVNAYTNARDFHQDSQVVIQDAEDQAIKNQKAAGDRLGTLALTIATPIPVENLPAGKVALKVAVVSYSLPNKAQWDKLVRDFTASDPQVAKIVLQRTMDGGSLNQLGAPLLKYDCVYAPFNGVTPSELPRLLNLDPFLAADSTFDKTDMIGGTLAQVTLDNKIWMLPSDISPNVLKIDSDRFGKDAVPLPGSSWTIEQFVDALKTFKNDPTGSPGFIPINTFGAYLFPLIAAYGGNPIDYRTNPPTINFTDPATIDAIQQVLNLAKDGEFKYHSLFSSRLDVSFKPEPSTIQQSTLTAFTLPLPTSRDNAKTQVTLFPKGSKYAAVTYNLGGFYISATAQNPDACYRFISKAARTPSLFTAMPARRSLLTDPTLKASQGADTVALYQQIATQLDDPNTLIFPGISLGADRTQIQLELELYEALDKAMLLNVDLTTALRDAETGAKAFEGCVASLPPLDVDVAKQRAYLNGFVDCATKSDPAMVPLYSGLKIN